MRAVTDALDALLPEPLAAVRVREARLEEHFLAFLDGCVPPEDDRV